MGIRHDVLQESLASHLRASTSRAVWTNMPLGPSSSPRPDVFTVDLKFSKFRADCYEVKASKADLRADLTAGKWRSYVDLSHAVWFAFEAGLVPLEEIPPECGVMVRGPTGWRAARRAKPRTRDNLPVSVWLKLVMEAQQRNVFGQRLAPRTAAEFNDSERIRKFLGDELAEVLSRRRDARKNYKLETAKLEALAKDASDEIARIRKSIEVANENKQLRLDTAARNLAKTLGMSEQSKDGTPTPLTHESLTARLKVLRTALESDALRNAMDLLQHLQVLIEAQVPSLDPATANIRRFTHASALRTARQAAAAPVLPNIPEHVADGDLLLDL